MSDMATEAEAPSVVREDRWYLYLAFLGGFLFTGVFTIAILVSAITSLNSGVGFSSSSPIYGVVNRLTLGTDFLAFVAFLWLGSRLDFRRRYAHLAALTFLGVFLGLLPGLVVILTSNSGGVAGFTVATDPGSLSSLIVDSFSAFTIPFAGLGFAFLSGKFEPERDAWMPPLVFFAVGFVLLLANYLSENFITPALAPFLETVLPLPSAYAFLGSNYYDPYVGWIFSPVLMLLAFYFLGKRFDAAADFKGFLVATFAASEAAYALGFLLNVDFAPSGLSISSQVNLSLVSDAVQQGFFFMGFAVTAVSLGLARALAVSRGTPSQPAESDAQPDAPAAEASPGPP